MKKSFFPLNIFSFWILEGIELSFLYSILCLQIEIVFWGGVRVQEGSLSVYTLKQQFAEM